MVCFAHCGSIAHLSSFCPLLANPKTPNHQFPRDYVIGRQTDFKGRPKVSVGQREVCNIYNSKQLLEAELKVSAVVLGLQGAT